MDYKLYKYKRVTRRVLLFAVLLICAIASGISCKVSLSDLQAGIPAAMRFMTFMFPPDLSAFSEMFKPATDTILFAFLATVFGSVLSFIFALAAAANLAPAWLRNTTRFLMTIERALPEVIILLLLISALGMGPFPGVVALSIGCIGMLGRLFADAIEEINPRVLESIASVGANKLQIIRYGVIPEVYSSIISNTLFRFEVNIRLSILMGAVGAGGIGYELFHAFNILQYERATSIILVILILIFLTEKLSDFLRKKLNPESQLK